METENTDQVLLRMRDAYLTIITSVDMDADNITHHENRFKPKNISHDRNSQILLTLIFLLVILILFTDIIVALLN